MTLVEKIQATVEKLPPASQADVLSYAESLRSEVPAGRKRPRRDLRGALAHLNVHVTREDIDEMRREALRNFPREDICCQPSWRIRARGCGSFPTLRSSPRPPTAR